jgi:iron(III) transport system substrate-binding protein
MDPRPRRTACLLAVTALLLAGCASSGQESGGPAEAKSITLYTCATENVEQAVIKAFEKENAGAKVSVFRAATGQLNARVAADQRSGGIKADVIWACDPLTMHGYDEQKLLRAWSPPNAGEIPTKFRTPHFTGIDLLYMVAAVHRGGTVPATWADLAGPKFRNRVALPSPTFAASALGLLGYFSATDGYGIDFYRKLKSNGAVQLNAPADTLTGVEQGTYTAGVTLANAAYADQKKGSPVQVVWPKPGGVAIYAPIGLTTKKNAPQLAEKFANFAASRKGQQVMAGLNTYVPIPGLGGPPIPVGSTTVSPDWPALFSTSKSVLSEYAKIFGG